MADLERIQGRLSNIQNVEPILSALRTISLGSWQAALNRRSRVQAFSLQLMRLLPQLAPHVPQPTSQRFGRRKRKPQITQDSRRVAAVVGSERGLCGRFNAAVVEAFDDYTQELDGTAVALELLALGSRVVRTLRQAGHEPDASITLSLTKLPPFDLAYGLTQTWLRRYEAYEIDAVDLIYNAYQGVGRYGPTVARLIPPEIPHVTLSNTAESRPTPAIIETDPTTLYARVVQHWAAVTLYGYLLDAATAEHSARYTLMEGAAQNTSRLIDELTLALHSARQQAITTEMQELAAGSGLVGSAAGS